MIIEDYFGIGGVIRNGVEYFMWVLGFWIDVVVVSVDQFQCWDYIVCGVVNVEQCVVWFMQWFCQYKSQFYFNVWYDKVIGWDIVVIVEEYVVQQCIVIWFVDL